MAATSPLLSRLFRPVPLFTVSALLRAVFLLYGLWQDANSPFKYTDIDYLVFTDAARFTHRGASPYDRETYRYTPFLAWLLLPTAWSETLRPAWFWFALGKVIFAAADLLAGWFLVRILRRHVVGMDSARALRFASIWLLNPMVATISTRGSSEGLLGVLVTALLWAVLERRVALAGVLLGFGVHFKIYPFIYAPAIVWWMDDESMGGMKPPTRGSSKQPLLPQSFFDRACGFLSPERIKLVLISLATFMGLNVLMYTMYGHHLPSPRHSNTSRPSSSQLCQC